MSQWEREREKVRGIISVEWEKVSSSPPTEHLCPFRQPGKHTRASQISAQASLFACFIHPVAVLLSLSLSCASSLRRDRVCVCVCTCACVSYSAETPPAPPLPRALPVRRACVRACVRVCVFGVLSSYFRAQRGRCETYWELIGEEEGHTRGRRFVVDFSNGSWTHERPCARGAPPQIR